MVKKSAKGWQKKYVFAVLFLLIAGLAVFGDNGLLDVYRVKSERDGIISYNMELEAENAKLERSISLLGSDKRYIGFIARKELGMIGASEVVYKLPEPR